jgi:hypothetical protein
VLTDAPLMMLIYAFTHKLIAAKLGVRYSIIENKAFHLLKRRIPALPIEQLPNNTIE